MQNYELLFILPGTLAENETQPIADKVKALVERNHGENVEISSVDKKRLAYPIKHIRYGYYFLVFFKAEQMDVQQMRAELRLMTELLRAVVQIHNTKHSLRHIEFIQLNTQTESAVGAPEAKPEDAVQQAERVVAEEKTEEKSEPEAVPQTIVAEEPAVVEKKPEPTIQSSKKESKKKIDLDEIDKKLDEILDIDLGSV